MNIATIREAFKATIEPAVPTIRVLPYEVEIAPDCVVVSPDEPFIDYHEAFKGGLARLNFRLMVCVQSDSPRNAQVRLDALLSSGSSESKSIIDAIEDKLASSGTMLGLTGAAGVVTGVTPYIVVANATGDGSYHRADLLCQVAIPRT